MDREIGKEVGKKEGKKKMIGYGGMGGGGMVVMSVVM